VEVRDQPRSAAAHWAQCASDASDGVRPDAAEDALLPLRAVLADAVAEKSAALGQDAPVQGALFLRHWLALSARRDAAAELYTPGAVQSAARSCAAQAPAGVLRQPEAPRVAVRQAELA
jgi:hypothetical protein